MAKANPTSALVALILLFMIIYYFGFRNNSTLTTNMNENDGANAILEDDFDEDLDFVIQNNICEIPRINPFSPALVTNLSLHITCAIQPHLSRPLVSKRLDNSTRHYVLHINVNWQRYYVHPDEDITCCYRDIQRFDGSESADFKPSVSSCHIFQQDFVVPLEVNGIIVNCMRRGSKKIIFMDAFFFIQKRENTTEHNKIGVLLLGIDSLSQINFRRRMPTTYKYLRNNKNDWYEMLGYNKIGYDAFPNLMALLTGYNLTTKHSDCNPHQNGNVDTCPFLWKQAKAFGMPTAFAEDRTGIHALTSDTMGFTQPPTDYYLRPYMLAAEHHLRLSAAFKLRKYCLGPRLSANYVLGYALEFALQLRGHGGLGLFWINSFRDSYDEPTIFQYDLYKYLVLLKMHNILENYVVILLSGNGMLRGRLNNFWSGFYEERLPILYISLPTAWKSKHPEFVNALNENRKRLISPLDLHQTVKHLLALGVGSQAKFDTVHDTDCIGCQSILKPIAEDRSCVDAGIDWMWCSCEPFYSHMTNSKRTALMMKSLLAEMNKFLQLAGLFNGTCHTLILHTLYGVYNSQHDTDYYHVKFKTLIRNAEFEMGLWYINNHKSPVPLSIDKAKIKRLDDEAVGCIQQAEDEFLTKLCVCIQNVVSTDSHMKLTDGVSIVTQST